MYFTENSNTKTSIRTVCKNMWVWYIPYIVQNVKWMSFKNIFDRTISSSSLNCPKSSQEKTVTDQCFHHKHQPKRCHRTLPLWYKPFQSVDNFLQLQTSFSLIPYVQLAKLLLAADWTIYFVKLGVWEQVHSFTYLYILLYKSRAYFWHQFLIIENQLIDSDLRYLQIS